MAAPLFTDREVMELLALPKWVEHEAWQHMSKNREGAIATMKARPDDEHSKLIFVIELEREPTCFGATLLVLTEDGRPRQAIARYDIQDSPHFNPRGMPPKMIESRQPHRHIHKERCVREFARWDRWAEPLKLEHRTYDCLRAQFIQDLVIHFSDTRTHNMFLEGME